MIKFQRGFTLIEAIIVITLTGIIAGMVAVFIRAPVQGYFDSARRAELTDTADTAVRRISRDLHLALPNSVRVTQAGAAYYLEFLQTSGGGRYRAAVDNSGGGNILDFTQPTSTFDVLGPPVSTVAGAKNLVVVYNLGVPGADAYQGDNTSPISGIAGNTVTISSWLFPFASPANRFQIVSYPVTYVCDPGAQTLTRFWNYPVQAGQPTSFAAGTPSALLARNVTGCSFSYDTQVITQRAGLVSAWLQITQSGESVSLYHEVHVSNVP
ncbi:MSHA biogenesis protein MshO [Sulfuriferula plumbiphila]|uniref:MSHA biogenesis protein MshO n=1 Tax=Sulfuriferula plumbiphila TaxID=171865 RepID=A0A512L7L6_9PROT|nr:prepilin-type N-terminal cleavage/methylation domain-containing protein [Sulfuriferula plumbiphila]BBP04003.1 MSHA biogenesis protein MshO [Sulfuriferula plumbiphila]GEP30480.1 MSHA biogenesis protein MshO [Sulfuriferula plumbiphila]